MKRTRILVEKYEVAAGCSFLDWQDTAPSLAHALRIAGLPASTELTFNEHGWAMHEKPGTGSLGDPVVFRTVFTLRN